MSEPQSLDPANRELAEALESLRLAPTQAAEREIWFAAGMEAGRKRANAWRTAAALMTLAAGAIALHGKIAPPAAIDRGMYAQSHNSTPGNAAYSTDAVLPATFSTANLRLRNAVLQNGWDALPAPMDGIEESPPLRPGMSLPTKDG